MSWSVEWALVIKNSQNRGLPSWSYYGRYGSVESVSQSCLTLCDPMNYSPPGSLSLGILHTRILVWVAIPIFRGSSQFRDWTQISCIARGFFTIWATREALIKGVEGDSKGYMVWELVTHAARKNQEGPGEGGPWWRAATLYSMAGKVSLRRWVEFWRKQGNEHEDIRGEHCKGPVVECDWKVWRRDRGPWWLRWRRGVVNH